MATEKYWMMSPKFHSIMLEAIIDMLVDNGVHNADKETRGTIIKACCDLYVKEKPWYYTPDESVFFAKQLGDRLDQEIASIEKQNFLRSMGEIQCHQNRKINT